MGSFQAASNAEEDYRRELLAQARTGKATAREELQREYNVRVYSDAERAALIYEAAPLIKGRLSKRHLELGMQWAEDSLNP
jgi:hypothetical protein